MHPGAALSAVLLALSLVGSPARAGTPTVAAAERLLEAGDIDAALADVRAAVAAHPDDVEANELLIDILTSTGHGSSVAETYGARAQAAPTSPDAWYLAGRAEPDPDRSLADFERALKLAPNHARAWMGVGAVRRAKGDAAGAREAYQKAVDNDPSLVEAWNGLWIATQALKGTDAGIAVLKKAVEALPGEGRLWVTLAALQSPAEARKTLETAARKLPDDLRVRIALARARMADGDGPGAEAAYDRALAQAPSRTDLLAERGIAAELAAGRLDGRAARDLLSARSGNPSSTLGKLDAVIVEWPESGWARMVRGNLEQAMGDSRAAETDLRAALARLPESAEAQAALGLVLLSEHKADEAKPLLEAAARKRPNDESLAVAAAVAVAQADGPDAGRTALEAVSKRFPNGDGAVLALARLDLAQGEAKRAMNRLKAAMQRRTRTDPQLALAYVAAARQAGDLNEATSTLEALAAKTGDPRYAAAARQIRDATSGAGASSPPRGTTPGDRVAPMASGSAPAAASSGRR